MATTMLSSDVRALAVLDEAGRIVVLLAGDDAADAAAEWQGEGYELVAVELH